MKNESKEKDDILSRFEDAVNKNEFVKFTFGKSSNTLHNVSVTVSNVTFLLSNVPVTLNNVSLSK